jgi:Zn-dependent oligopeptidase
LKQEKDDNGVLVYYVTLKAPELPYVLDSCVVEASRSRLLAAAHRRCQEKNSVNLKSLLLARLRAAKILGFQCWADYKLEQNMAKTKERANSFLMEMLEKLRGRLKSDLDTLKETKMADCLRRGLSYDNQIHLWDVAFYEKVHLKENFALDDEEIKNYFPSDWVTERVMDMYVAGLLNLG